MKLTNPPEVLVRRKPGLTSSAQQCLCYNSDTAATAPSAASDGADCSTWSQVAIVCKKAAAAASYSTRLWWYYCNAGVWVADSSVDQTVTDAEHKAFVVNTGAASAVYVEVTVVAGAPAAYVVAEANQ